MILFLLFQGLGFRVKIELGLSSHQAVANGFAPQVCWVLSLTHVAKASPSTICAFARYLGYVRLPQQGFTARRPEPGAGRCRRK